jgi:hypothetical protein
LKKQVLEISCDVCGRPLDNSSLKSERAFTIDGVPYQIDLCPDHSEEFATAIAPFVANARRVSKPRTNKSSGLRSPRRASDLKSVRAWASDNGFSVSERGRLPGEVIAAYNRAAGIEDDNEVSSTDLRIRSRSRTGVGRRSNGRSRAAKTAATS